VFIILAGWGEKRLLTTLCVAVNGDPAIAKTGNYEYRRSVEMICVRICRGCPLY